MVEMVMMVEMVVRVKTVMVGKRTMQVEPAVTLQMLLPSAFHVQ